MTKRLFNSAAVFCFAAILLSFGVSKMSAQTTDGSIAVQTMDTTKALLTGAHLVLTEKDMSSDWIDLRVDLPTRRAIVAPRSLEDVFGR